MRHLVLTDIHANLEALEAVLADAGEYEAVLCLGDLVGYGPNPNECVDCVRELAELTCLAGNHDWAAIGKLDLSSFNAEARKAAEWTQAKLRPDVLTYLKGLPAKLEREGYALAHGSPRDPIWEYLVVDYQGPPNFE
ncbi:MAG: metallophosphoesterase, partial [Chloroflexi bacterium]|nr:metallophosphoesterase [Chloroflexota bacterium]